MPKSHIELCGMLQMLDRVFKCLVLLPYELAFEGGFPKCLSTYQLVAKPIVDVSKRASYGGF